MKRTSVRRRLDEACREIHAACDAVPPPGDEKWLVGVTEQLRYYVDGDRSDPEARIYPPAGVLDGMVRRLEEVVAETDDEEAVEHLERASDRLREATAALSGRRE